MTVISGHQRLKACKDLNIEFIPAIMRGNLVNENEKLKVLLAANFGRAKNDEAKMRKIAVRYVELCGGTRGGDRKSKDDNRTLKLEEIAKQLGISTATLKELLAIDRKLTPEIKELIDNGTISKTTASKLLTKLTQEEQKELLLEFGEDILNGLATQIQIQKYIDEIKTKMGGKMEINYCA